MVTAAAALSAAGRYSMVWLGFSALGAMAADDRTGFAVFFVAVAVEWMVTNGPLKLLFRRTRPDNADVVDLLPDWLHPPRSSSFPSGHSSAAAFSAVIWWSWSPLAGVVVAILAAAMGASRIVLRAHHRSDVVAGWLWGALLGGLALALLGDALPG